MPRILLALCVPFVMMSGCAREQGSAQNAGNGPAAADVSSNGSRLDGHEVGNGGDAVICHSAYPELGGKSTAVLDYFEARARWRWTLALGAPDLSVAAKIEMVLSRVDAVDPDRAALYRSYWTTFWSETETLANAHLPDLPDDGPIALPGPDCQLVQAAIRREPHLPGDKRYSISKEVWEQLDNDNQAGLILHELIYREASGLGQSTSINARYYNALASANRLVELTQADYVDLLQRTLGLPAIFSYRGLRFELGSVEHDAQWHPHAATLVDTSLKLADVIYSLVDRHVVFTPSGDPSIHAQTMVYNVQGMSANCTSTITHATVDVTSTGRPSVISLEEGSDNPESYIKTCSSDEQTPTMFLALSPGSQIKLESSGLPVGKVTIGRNRDFDSFISLRDGRLILLPPDETITLDNAGIPVVDLPLPNLAVERPNAMVNQLVGDPNSATMQISDQGDSSALWNALQNASSIHDTDGDRRAFAFARSGFVLACKRWSDGETACRLQINRLLPSGISAEPGFSQDSGSWKFSQDRSTSRRCPSQLDAFYNLLNVAARDPNMWQKKIISGKGWTIATAGDQADGWFLYITLTNPER